MLLPVAVIAFALAGFGCGGGDSDETTAAAADVSTAATTAEVETEDVETEDVSATAEDDTTEPSTVAGAVPASEWLGTSVWRDLIVAGRACGRHSRLAASLGSSGGEAACRRLPSGCRRCDGRDDRRNSRRRGPDVAQGERSQRASRPRSALCVTRSRTQKQRLTRSPPMTRRRLGRRLKTSALRSRAPERGWRDLRSARAGLSGLRAGRAAANEPACAGIAD